MFQIILIKPNDFNLDDIPYKSTPNKVYKNITRNDFLQITGKKKQTVGSSGFGVPVSENE